MEYPQDETIELTPEQIQDIYTDLEKHHESHETDTENENNS